MSELARSIITCNIIQNQRAGTSQKEGRRKEGERESKTKNMLCVKGLRKNDVAPKIKEFW